MGSFEKDSARWIVFVVLFSVLAGAGCTKTKEVRIASEPAGATVLLNGVESGVTPLSKELSFGDRKVHQLVLKMPGYEEATASVAYEPEDTKQYSLRLAESTKSVTITTEPKGANLSINGVEVGASPVTKELAFGKRKVHEIVAKSDGFSPARTTIELEPPDKTHYLLKLKELTKVVAITSEPSGAKVFIDGVDSGTVPLSKELAFGLRKFHDIVVKKDGYAEDKFAVALDPVEKKDYLAKLKELTKHVVISSDPAGAAVLLDGQEAGVTPLTKELAFGQRRVHEVVLRKDGFLNAVFSVELEPHDKKDYKASLKDMVKEFEIVSEPKGATVVLDGTDVGLTPLTRQLAFGLSTHHDIVLKKAGYEDVKASIGLHSTNRDAFFKLTKIESIVLPLLAYEPEETDKGFKLVEVQKPTIAYLETMDQSSNAQGIMRFTSNDNKEVQLGAPAVSPQDGAVVYAMKTMEGGTYSSNLWRQAAESASNKIRITTGRFNDMFPTFTPDGQHIVFTSNRAGTTPTLWRIRAFGAGGITRITNGMSSDYAPSVGHNGEIVVYISIPPASEMPQIWSIDTKNGAATQLREGESPHISPDGKKILFVKKDQVSGRKQIWLINLDGSEETLMTTATDHDEIDPEWSPDGSMYTFASNEGLDSHKRQNFDVWVAAVDGSFRSQLTTNGSRDDGPSFNKDGRSIYFRSNRGGVWNIWRVDLNIPGMAAKNAGPSLKAK